MAVYRADTGRTSNLSLSRCEVFDNFGLRYEDMKVQSPFSIPYLLTEERTLVAPRVATKGLGTKFFPKAWEKTWKIHFQYEWSLLQCHPMSAWSLSPSAAAWGGIGVELQYRGTATEECILLTRLNEATTRDRTSAGGWVRKLESTVPGLQNDRCGAVVPEQGNGRTWGFLSFVTRF